MRHEQTDKNLLFGVLALQMDFISRDDLVEAMNRWVLHKQTPLGEVLVEQKCLSSQRHALLSALVDEHLQQHDNDPQKSLASISGLGSVRDDLRRMDDDDVQASLAFVAAKPASTNFQDSATLMVGSAESSGQRFRILRPYAKGGLGEVSIAEDIELHRDVALKEIQPQFAHHDESRTRFVLEAEITGSLEHPGIVPVYGLGQYGDGRPYYAMRFVRGDSLHDAIKRFHKPSRDERRATDRALEQRKLLGRFIDVCNAIEYAHSRGVLHRDLKPGNVMLGKYGETLVVDWGLAKVLDRQESEPSRDEKPIHPQSSDSGAATQLGKAIGTPAYMAPEQAGGRLDELGRVSDVYSLGATLYHLLTGHAPFKGDDTGVILQRVQTGDFPPPREINAQVSRPLEAICLKAMSLRPADRYRSPAELAEDIEHWLADEPVSAYSEPLAQRTARWMRRHRSWTMAGAAALILVAIVSVFAIVVVNSAKEREAQAWELTAKTRFFDIQLLERENLDNTGLTELEQLLDEIGELSSEDSDVRRKRLYEAYAEQLQQSLDVPRFSDEDRLQFDQHVAVLDARRSRGQPELGELIKQLEAARDARLSKWDMIFDLDHARMNQFESVFDSGDVESDDGTSLRRTRHSPNQYEPTLTQVACPPGNIELQATFDRSWTRAALLGISLNASDDHRYDFLLAVPSFDFRDATDEELRDLPMFDAFISRRDSEPLSMLIMRDGQPLRQSPIHLDEGRLRMLARREGGTLIFTVNDAKTIKFEDPFPLPAKQPGAFGVYWPSGVHVEQLQALRLRTPIEPSPIEQGDELYASGQFSDALKSFAEIDSIEAQYKAALCQFELNEPEKFELTLVELAGQPPSGAGHSDDAWRLRATSRLLQYRVESRDWPDVRRLLRELQQVYERDEIVNLIPATQHEMIFQYFRRPGGNRSQFFGDRTNAIEDLQWALLVEQLFNEDAASHRITRWRLADAYRWNDNPGEALKIIRALIDETPEEEMHPLERIALLIDLYSLVLEMNGAVAARDEVNRWLLDEAGEIRHEYFPLLSVRAASYMIEDNNDAAEADLEYYFHNLNVEELHYAHYAHACSLRGMLYERAGDMQSAEQYWRKGLRRNWHEPRLTTEDMVRLRGHEAAYGLFATACDLMLGAWSNELTEDEAYQEIWNLYPGSGVFSTSFRKLVEVTLEPPFVLDVVMASNRSPRGRARGQQNFLEFASPGDAVDGTSWFIRLSCFTNIEVTSEIDELVYTSCKRGLNLFFDGTYGEGDIKDILNLWRGRFSKSAFNRLVRKSEDIDAELLASVAFAFGNKYYSDDNLEVAKFLFEYVLDSDHVHPLVDRLTREQYAKLTSGQPGNTKPVGNIQ